MCCTWDNQKRPQVVLVHQGTYVRALTARALQRVNPVHVRATPDKSAIVNRQSLVGVSLFRPARLTEACQAHRGLHGEAFTE